MLVESRDMCLRGARGERFIISSFEAAPLKKDKIPAVVHVDGTMRPKLVCRHVHPRYYDLVRAFGEKTGESAVLNTSLHVKREPIVCNPREAVKSFFDTGLEALVLGSFVVLKLNLLAPK